MQTESQYYSQYYYIDHIFNLHYKTNLKLQSI